MSFKSELLAPAGSLKVLKAAVNTGADAVYFGLNEFNARIFANNFSNGDFINGMEYLKMRGKKGYVTLNTLIKDAEINKLITQIELINSVGVDAVIVQDFGVASLIKKVAPNLQVHGSTQMTIHNLSGVELANELGISRVVLSRELSLEDISFIRKHTNCELEVFCHGALCVCFSGACLMSSFLGDRSGNRGSCAGPCRMKYSYKENEKYFLSLKDLSTVDIINELQNMKIESLKIEGRLKSEYYVATVVDAYRRILDGEKLSKNDLELLFNIFNRGGYTDGYLSDNKGKSMFTFLRNENPYSLFEKQAKDKFKEIIYKDLKDNLKRLPIDFSGEFKVGKQATLSALGTTVHSDGIIEQAKNLPTSKEKIEENLAKLTDTPYSVNSFSLDVDETIFMPIGEINKLRRNLISQLESKTKKEENPFYPYEFSKNERRLKTDLNLILKVRNSSQFLWALKQNLKVFVPYDVLLENKALCVNKDLIYITIPRVAFDKELSQIEASLCELKKLGFEQAVVSNLSHFKILKEFKLVTDPLFHTSNSIDCDFMKDIDISGVSLELNLNEIARFEPKKEIMAFGYGHVEMMICENCLKKSITGKCHPNVLHLKDRKSEELMLLCAFGCRNEILNPYPIVMSDRLHEIKEAGINYLILSFTKETQAECDFILNNYKKGVNNVEKFTRGHFYRGAK